ncbi:transmembrane protein 126A [Macrobrachium rosenbergii]|uniref:transmembrane protein 126A n=1 Tax=Macrobrachium rosenbergii TaxID=79674 RepID=UPI0034D4B919
MPSKEFESFMEAYSVIDSWKPASDVYAIKNYPLVTGLASSLSGAYINSYYRQKVKLRSRVFFPTAVPMIFLPVFVSTILHHQFVQRPLILQKFQCPVCIELRGGAIQLFAGFIYPMVLGPVVAFHFASTLYTYALPTIKEPKKLLDVFLKFTKPVLPRLWLIAGAQTAIGMALTHAEAYNLFTVISKVSMMEQQLKENKAPKDEFTSF